jgi:hypothetical protein
VLPHVSCCTAACFSPVGMETNLSDLLPLTLGKGKIKAIPVTGRGGPYDCETSRLPHFLDNQFRDGGEIVSLTRRPPLPPRKIPGTHFC